MEHLYVSFHGGGGSGAYNNIHVYTLGGTEVGKALDKHTLPPNISLDELRGFTIGPDDRLYVANAHKSDSLIVRYQRQTPTSWGFESIYVDGDPVANGLDHPYDIVFGPDGHLYASNQDNGLVTRYGGPDSAAPGAPLPSVIPGGTPGTFAAITDASAPGKFSIRSIAFGPGGNLYVADEKSDSIHVFDADGHQLDAIASTTDATIDAPVQVRFDAAGTLFIGSAGNDSVLTYSGGVLRYLIGPGGKHLDRVSGIGFDSAGRLYVGSRKNDKVLAYTLPDAAPTTVLDHLSDNPEFVEVISTP